MTTFADVQHNARRMHPKTSVRSDMAAELANAVLHALKLAHDDAEQRVARELERASASHSNMRREIDEARAKIIELQKDLDKASTQKNYVTDAFESSRKECARLRAENQANQEDMARLRKMIEESQQERIADGISRRAVHADLSDLEHHNDVLGRALGSATKLLYKQQAAAAESATSSLPIPVPAKVRGGSTPAKKGRPAGKALSSSTTPGETPRQTGESGKKATHSSAGSRGLPW